MLLLLGVPLGLSFVGQLLFPYVTHTINPDFFVIYVLAVLLARRSRRAGTIFASVAIVASLAIDLLIANSLVYLDGLTRISQYVSFWRSWPWQLIGMWMVGIVMAGIVSYPPLRRIPLERAANAPVSIMLLLLLAIDKIPRWFGWISFNVSISGAYRLLTLLPALMHPVPFSAKPAATPMMVDLAKGNPPPRLLSVAVESFGVAQDERINAALLDRFRKRLGQQFQVVADRHLAKGFTLAGELRELCAVRAEGVPVGDDIARTGLRCLAGLLAAQGYATLGVHGNTGNFYRRREIYPQLGFRDTMFFEDFRRDTTGVKCKSLGFAGVCDRETVEMALSYLGTRAKAYAHVVTLETHLPLMPSHLGGTQCGLVSGIAEPQICLYINQIDGVLGEIAAAVRSSRVPPDEVYLFGDHPPPFLLRRYRNYFDSHAVPFWTVRRVAGN